MSDRSNRDSFRIGLLERGDCRNEAAQLAISSYLDGEADSEERYLAENHLEDCLTCQGRVIVWRQEARLLGSSRYTEGPAYQIQAEVRAAMQSVINQGSRPSRQAVPARAFGGVLASLVVLGAFTFLLTRLNLTNPVVISTPVSAAITMSAANTATARVNGPVIIGNFAFAPTPTIAVNSFSPPTDLQSALQSASVVRYYPAPTAGRFAGYTAVLAWYADKSSRMWLLDKQRTQTEVSLDELAETNNGVRFYYDDPQAVLWSERGAIVSYHLADSPLNEWGLVVPQSGRVSAARLVQPATAAALAVKPTYSPVPRPQN